MYPEEDEDDASCHPVQVIELHGVSLSIAVWFEVQIACTLS